MVAEIISLEFMAGAFFVGVIIGLFTIATGDPILKIIDIIALVAIIGGLMMFMPGVNSQMTTKQAVDKITDLMMYFVNVVIPFIIGDICSSVGYMLVTGERN